jgi:hypothetical protein
MNYELLLKGKKYNDILSIIKNWENRLNKLNVYRHPNSNKLVKLRTEMQLRVFALKAPVELIENEVQRRIDNN